MSSQTYNRSSSLRTITSAFISTTTPNPATEITRSHDAQGPPLTSTGKPRREVPLPSQEKKEGAMQYALYVSQDLVNVPSRSSISSAAVTSQDTPYVLSREVHMLRLSFSTEQQLTK